MDHRQIGKALASHLNQASGVPSVAAMQGMIADLAADHPDLLVPMRDLVTRPAFQGLIAKADSGGGILQRDALINEVRPLFSAPVLEALTELLNGFLNLPPSPNQHQAPAAGEGHRQAPPSSAAPSVQAHPSGTAPPKVKAAAAAPSGAGQSRGFPWLVTLVVAALVAVAGVALRSPPLCGFVNLCQGDTGSPNAEQILSAARRAEQALRRATTLEQYRSALEQLDGELLRLRDAPLSQQQQQQRDALSASAKQAQTVLTEEQADQQRVEKAAEALQAAQKDSGAARKTQLAVARQELAGIPPRSFAAAEASRLRQQLEQLELSVAVPEEAPAASPPEERSSPSAPQQPRAPAPSPAPYREQPLF